MDTLTAPAPDLLDASPAAAVMPPLAEQLDALRQQHHSALEEVAAFRPPSSDPPQAAAKNRAKRKRAPTGRRRGGQLGHSGHHRALLAPDQATQVIVVRPVAAR